MKKVKKGKNFKRERLLISLSVIIFYLICPYIIAAIKKLFNIGDCLFLSIILHLALVMILLFIYRKDLKDYFDDFKKNKKKYLKLIIIFAIISILAVIVINGIIIHVLNINHVTENENALLESFKTYPLIVSLLTIVYYPIVEEIVFEKTIKDVISNKWLFIILSALFFWYYNIAYIGGISYITIISSLYYFVAGFIRALVFYKTDNLYVPMGIKSLCNLFVTIIS